MRRTFILAAIAATLTLFLVGSAAAITIPIAQAGQTPGQGISIITGENSDSSAIDTISFFSSPSGTIMTSTLYPITNASCEEDRGKRTLPATPGDYCIVIDAIAYTFTLTDISEDSVDFAKTGTIGKTEEGTQLTHPAQATPPTPTTSNAITGMASLDASNADNGIISLQSGILPVALIILIACIAIFRVWWHR